MSGIKGLFKIHEPTALFAVLLATPIAALGTLSWITAWAHNYSGPIAAMADNDAGEFFLLGSPLTLIVLNFNDYAGRPLSSGDDWWALPLTVALFFTQWIIWSQIPVLAIRLLRPARFKKLH